ncbi:type VI secretion system contractile sheath domain-containing protein [Humitalea sp. 24SJ18S-53]|uniref:type VI secretion system contractile sheath domain-containing protein n=1 Tax=Humitalea sp. 24SJ18S-53 TaxID=3422307 RepID=UPI003D67CF13
MTEDNDPLAAIFAATEARQRESAGVDPRAADLFAIDARIAALTEAIVTAPAFIAARDRWQALRDLVDSGAQVAVLPVSPRELQRDLGRGTPAEDSALMQIMEHAEAEGAAPAVLLVDRPLGHEADDVALLRGLAVVGETLLCAVVAEAAPGLLGEPAQSDPARLHESPAFAPFRTLRVDAGARFLALVVGSGWTLVTRLAATVAEDGWGAGAEGEAPSPTAAALARSGLASGATLPSLHRPPKLDRPEATEAAQRAARLPAVIASARVMRALRVRAARALHAGTGQAGARVQAWLDTVPEAAGSTVAIKMQDGMAVLEARLRLAMPDAATPLPLRLAVVV